MSLSRRDFFKSSILTGISPFFPFDLRTEKNQRAKGEITVLSTWDDGMDANERAVETLKRGGSALDAVEEGVKVEEADPKNNSVGLGGLPDEDGHVTLDACIMDSNGNAGSTAFLQDIKHPISVARKIMEKTNHVMLVGDGAKRFALAEGFEETNLLTEESKDTWLKWKETQGKKDKNHDTIAMLALDESGNLAGACTTSGLSFKMHGRVGDSPIIGAGLYCDNEVGGAGATGRGEEVIKTVGSFLIVELMRQGWTPNEACEEAIKRIAKKYTPPYSFQVAYIALRIDGEVGSSAIKDGFQYSLYKNRRNELLSVKGLYY